MANREGTTMFDPEDWLARLHEAGGRARVDAVKMWPPEVETGQGLSPECEAIWAEIRGTENVDKWRRVEELVRSKVGPFVGWADY
jgi:hypothetical protein